MTKKKTEIIEQDIKIKIEPILPKKKQDERMVTCWDEEEFKRVEKKEKKKLCNNCRFLDLSFNGHFSATCKKKYFKNIKYSNPMIAHPKICKPTKCDKFKYYDEKKKQQYIYVARDNDDEGCLQISFVKMSKVHYPKDFGGKNIFHFSGKKTETKGNKLKLKKGEQKRMSIDVDKAEKV